ncbi:MAG: mechanosensitive ion channel family protein [Phycisphaerae bacterium]|nr:mechanosensitive ion channel family protein [Phycisphaerae bacterium]
MLLKSVIRHCRVPLIGLIGLIFVRSLLPLWPWAEANKELITTGFSLAMIVLISWLVIKSTQVLRDVVTGQFDITAKDNLRARKVHTQLDVMRHIVVVIVLVVAFGTALMVFPKGQQIGTTLLASAGIIGIVVGMSAQKTITTVIAGLQIAFTQPIRLDDVVIVESEWGRIEEITLTYVVVRIWDQRRLIVPVTYFIEKPFQNWTRTTAELLGTVFLYTDYTVPVDAVRQTLQGILDKSPLWDKRVCVLQVTNATEKTMELRALMSTANASDGWDLRCQVREKLLTYIQESHPDALPRTRAVLARMSDEK